MDLKKAFGKAHDKKDELVEMAELFHTAIKTEESLKEKTSMLDELERRITEAEGDTVKWNNAKTAAKAALNEMSATLSEAKREAREAIAVEKNAIIRQKAAKIEDLSTRISGKEANLIVLEGRENELKTSISRMEVTIEDQYKKFMASKVG